MSGRKWGEALSRREAGRGRSAVRCPSTELAVLGTGDTMTVGAGVESDIGNLGPKAQAWDGRQAQGKATADHRGEECEEVGRALGKSRWGAPSRS